MRRVILLGIGVLAGCSGQPPCLLLNCTQNFDATCNQILQVADACGLTSTNSVLTNCESDLSVDCSEADSTGLLLATGCFGSSTACAGAAQTVEACFNAQTLSSSCRGATQGQIKIFLPDGG
jgi:hypothetical protein